ncbi:MAG: M23 family metallopeptidase [Turicibacter sp.]
MKKIISVSLIVLLVFSTVIFIQASSEENIDSKRMQLYKEFEFSSGVPWYQIAAVDQYERNTVKFREECTFKYEIVSMCFPNDIWSGPENPIHYDKNSLTINLFGGIGKDGNDDGLIDINDEQDVLYTMVNYLLEYDDFEKAVESYYQNEQASTIVKEIASLFKQYETITLDKRSFPVAKRSDYSYQDNYGAARGWGGSRSHEGIDVFASYSTPVLSTAYGVIEIVGWNDFGGYRIGIRDIYNTYQYYAHLQGFEGNLQAGDIVEPGQVIGYVGSTGYGKEGTSGKFPPHLHFGLYKYDGRHEWAFNPYSHMRKWEKVK